MMRKWHGYRAYLAAFGLLVISGCAPTRQLAPVPDGHEPPPASPSAPKVATADVPPPETKPSEPSGYRISGKDPLVGERIAVFEKKKVEWYRTGVQLAELKTDNAWPDSWQECLQDIELALNGYRQLQAEGEFTLNPWAIVGRDVHYFDLRCDQVLDQAQAKLSSPREVAPTPAVEPMADQGDQIRHLYEAGHYQEAVSAFETLAQDQEITSLPRVLREFYCRSLIKLDRLPEAIRLMTELLQGPMQATDLSAIDFKILTADLLVATGQINEARELYTTAANTLEPAVLQQTWATTSAAAFAEQMNSEDLALYQELIQAYLLFDGQRLPQLLVDGVSHLQGRPPSPLLDLAKLLLSKAQAHSQAWARRQLAEVRVLLDRQELVPARELVERVAAVAPPELREAITTIQDEISRAEAAAAENPDANQGATQIDPWQESIRLVEQQRYDEAIAGFQQQLDGIHGDEAKIKMAEAAELAASALRRQAAALYAKASKTFDPESKRQTLQRSRALLMELLAKYPETSITAKARQNLKVLDATLGQGQPDSSESLPDPMDDASNNQQ